MRIQIFTSLQALCWVLLWSLNGVALTQAAEARSVDVLLLMDTHADKIGSKIQTDSNYIVPMFEELASQDRRVNISVLSGTALSPTAIRRHFNRLPRNPQSAIVVVYDGHGGSHAGEHFLACKYGSITRAEMAAMIKSKSPRLGVLYTSSCGGSGGVSSDEIRINRSEMTRHRSFNAQSIQDLMFRSTGFVDLNSSRSGIVSWLTEKGSLGIHAFVDALSANTFDVDALRPDGFLHWNEVADHMQRATSRYTGVHYDGPLKGFEVDIQVASPLSSHAPDRMPGWRVGFEVQTHWLGDGIVVRSIAPGSSAALAKLRELDRIVSIDGRPIRNAWHDLSSVIRNANERVDIDIERIVDIGSQENQPTVQRFTVNLELASETTPKQPAFAVDSKALFDLKKLCWQLYSIDFDNRFPDWQNFRGSDPNRLKQFAWLCACGRGVFKGYIGVRACREACEATGWRNADFIAVLAAAYAADGDFLHAVTYQARAVELAAEEDKSEYSRRLRLYENSRFYADPF